MTRVTRIAYLVPEFPGQTHILFWRERAALLRLGITPHLISTRRPPKTIRSHDWADQAERETFYLSDVGLWSVFEILLECFRVGPKAWRAALKVAANGRSLKEWFLNVMLMLGAMRLINYMRKNGLTHLHSHSCANAALIALFANQLAKISYSLTLHGDLRDYGRQQKLKWRHAEFAITITRRLHEQVRLELGEALPGRIGLAPMGVDTLVFKRETPYAPWSGEGPFRLFSCGRLNFIKGHQDLIQAVALVRSAGMDAYLEIAGEDEAGGHGFRRVLDKLIAELKLSESVRLLSAVNEERVLRSLTAAHVFALVSHHEPLGVAIMEALSCETPVLATDQGGVPELIEHCVDGYLIAPKDPSKIAAGLRYIAQSPTLAMRFSAAGRRKIVQRFNSDLSAIELGRLLGN